MEDIYKEKAFNWSDEDIKSISNDTTSTSSFNKSLDASMRTTCKKVKYPNGQSRSSLIQESRYKNKGHENEDGDSDSDEDEESGDDVIEIKVVNS
jgi:hypothetical protein